MNDLAKRRFLVDLLFAGGVIALVAGLAATPPKVREQIVQQVEQGVEVVVQIFYPSPGLVGNLG